MILFKHVDHNNEVFTRKMMHDDFENGIVYYPLNIFTVPHIHRDQLEDPGKIKVCPSSLLDDVSGDPTSIIDKMIANPKEFVPLTLGIYEHIAFSAGVRMLAPPDKPTLQGIHELAAIPISPVGIMFDGCMDVLSEAIIPLGLAKSPTAMIVATLVHPLAMLTSKETKSTQTILNYLELDRNNESHVENLVPLCTQILDENKATYSGLTSCLASMAYMAITPKFSDTGVVSEYWVKFTEHNFKKVQDGRSRRAPRALAHTIMHAMELLISVWLYTTTPTVVNSDPNELMLSKKTLEEL